jgi:hypothetical protein
MLLHYRHGAAVLICEVFAVPFHHNRHFENLIRVWSVLGRYLKQRFYELAHVHRVVTWNRRVLAFEHSFEETVHIVCAEGWHQLAHFIDNTAKRPNVRLQVIRLIFPNLG